MDPQNALDALNEIPLSSLNILRISHPILSDPNTDTTLLTADLTHYRDLFAKLRFSYVEQVTKEKFLTTLTSTSPTIHTAEQNAALETELLQAKAALKERKQEVREMMSGLEAQGRSLATRYEIVTLQRQQLENLPVEIEGLRESIAAMQLRREPQSEDARMAMPLGRTREVLEGKERELGDVERRIEELRGGMGARRARVEVLRDEIVPLQLRKIKAVEEAQEARRKGDGGELEAKGRWLQGVERSLRVMLEV